MQQRIGSKFLIAGNLFSSRMGCFILLLNLALPVAGQTILTLDSVERAIRMNHPALQMLESEARAMDEAAKGAYSWMPPELGAGFYQTPYDPGRWKAMNGRAGMGAFMITAKQMFPNPRKQEAEYNYMRARSAVENQRRDAVLNDLLYTARKSIYEWIVLEKKLKILDDNEKLLRFMLQSAEIRYKNGLGKISAYYKVKAALAKLENDRLLYRNEIIRKRIAINTVMNRDPGEPVFIDSNLSWFAFDPGQFDSTSLVNQRSDIKVLDKSIQVNSLEREMELTALKPEFGIQYSHMTGWARQPSMFSVMGMIKIPLASWSSRMYKAKAESLIWENEALKNRKLMIVNESTGMAATALTELDLNKKQMTLYEKEIIPALRRNFQTMELGYEQNTEQLFELFDAWEALNDTQMQYLDKLKDALLMQADLMKIAEIK